MKYSKLIILFYIRTNINQCLDFVIYDYSKSINNEKHRKISYCFYRKINIELLLTEYLLSSFELIKYK